MGSENWLHEFYETIEEDSRITVTHVSLYIAIRFIWENDRVVDCMEIDRSRLMMLGKISSRVTYDKCMHSLHEFGYIQYMPYCGRRKSELRLRKL